MICPLCKSELSTSFLKEETVVLNLLSERYNGHRRSLYEGTDGSFWITYQGGGEVSRDLVFSMLKKGLIVYEWPDIKCNSFVLKEIE